MTVEGVDSREALRISEKLSAPWRQAVMEYLEVRGADPIEVADALWRYSLVMCGNSPANVTRTRKEKEEAPLLAYGQVEGVVRPEIWMQLRWKKRLQQTCYACVLLPNCRYAIPAQPYYRKGQLVLQEHPLRGIQVPMLPDPVPGSIEIEEELQQLLMLTSPEITS